jgi:hypothetical protein
MDDAFLDADDDFGLDAHEIHEIENDVLGDLGNVLGTDPGAKFDLGLRPFQQLALRLQIHLVFNRVALDAELIERFLDRLFLRRRA